MSNTPIRIAFDASNIIPQPLTGVGYYTLFQLEALAKQNFDLDLRLFASSAQVKSKEFTHLSTLYPHATYKNFSTRIKNVLWTHSNYPPIEKFCGEVDIAHGGFHLTPASRTPNRVVTVFDLVNLRQAATKTTSNALMHLKLLQHATHKAENLIAISQSCKEDIVDLLGFPEEKVDVVYGGVQLNEFTGDLNLEKHEILCKRYNLSRPYFIYLGTLEPRKNLPRLIAAYARSKEKHEDIPALVLVGKNGWMYEDIFETVTRLKLEKDVVFTGYVERSEAITLLKGAYACTYPSLYEGFGLPVLEAMAARVPVLTSNVSSLPEVIGDTGIQVDPESVDAIEDGLNNLIENYDQAQARLDAAYERAKKFSWDNSAHALYTVYRNMLK